MKHVILIALMLVSLNVQAKVDLVTLPERDSVQLTIYNSADLTLVRESRQLTMKEGRNALQFSWAETLIDPTSLSLEPKANIDKIDVLDLTFPARVKQLGLWNIESTYSGKTPVEITYFTSGLSWRAFYMGTMTPDEQQMKLEGYVVVTNNSGEDYGNAQTRLIVGEVHLMDLIAELARREYPYGAPMLERDESKLYFGAAVAKKDEDAVVGFAEGEVPLYDSPKEIMKEGLSEYYLYTIEGTETIPNGWAKRLPSFDADTIPVVNLYKFEEERYGEQVVRFLSFTNDEEHKLGENPIPEGTLKAFRVADAQHRLSYIGTSDFEYVPIGEEVELNLGAVEDVIVEPKLMSYQTENYRFDDKGNISGWDEVRRYEIKVRNTKAIPAKVEIMRNVSSQYWSFKGTKAESGDYEKIDLDSFKFTAMLASHSEITYEYILTTYEGVRQEEVKQ